MAYRLWNTFMDLSGACTRGSVPGWDTTSNAGACPRPALSSTKLRLLHSARYHLAFCLMEKLVPLASCRYIDWTDRVFWKLDLLSISFFSGVGDELFKHSKSGVVTGRLPKQNKGFGRFT